MEDPFQVKADDQAGALERLKKAVAKLAAVVSVSEQERKAVLFDILAAAERLIPSNHMADSAICAEIECWLNSQRGFTRERPIR